MDSKAERGLDHVVVGDSSITLVAGESGGLVYRGHDIFELAPGTDYESIVRLLVYDSWSPERPPTDLVRALATRRGLPPTVEEVVDHLPIGIAPLDGLRTAVSAMSSEEAPYPPTAEQGLALIARSPTALARLIRRTRHLPPVAPRDDLRHVPNFLYMLDGQEPDARRVRGLETYFVLLADHGMNASTFALRVVLSTQADLFAAATAGLAALKGPAHGGAPARVSAMLDAVGRPERAASWVRGALARKERLYGFGHRAYKAEDPRSTILKRVAREIADPARFELAETVEREALAALERQRAGRRLYTNVEFYSAVVLESVGLPPELFTPCFALARTAGWTAHALEQVADNRLIRPDVRYTGAVPSGTPLGPRS